MKRFLIPGISPFVLLLFFLNSAFSHTSENGPGFIPNKGQWEKQVQYKGEFGDVTMFLERNGFTYVFRDHKGFAEYISHGRPGKSNGNPKIRHHAIKLNFLNSSATTTEGSAPRSGIYNFFIGNDSARWAGGLRKYSEVFYKDLYPLTDLHIYENDHHLKYDLILEPGADPGIIAMQYSGATEMFLRNGNLVIKTSLGEIVEKAPVAFSLVNNKRIPVICNFELKGNTVRFSFPEGYDRTRKLIIDPVLIFSSYSGSTADNFGMTATYDDAGNLYAGGIAFNTGYPVTTGAYDVTYGGPAGSGNTDVVISKYNPTGTAFVYSTYLGGTGSETVNSMIINQQDELWVYGVTGSSDFPTTQGCYDNSFNGGISISFPSNGAIFPTGTDIYVSRLSAAGDALLASTYIGGSANDGINHNSVNVNLIDSLHFNYGDVFRGEIICDTLGNAYITSSTRSTDFPVANAYSATLQGQQDAVVFKLNSTVSTLIFSTYLGGSEKDAGYSLKTDTLNNIYVTGGTSSLNFPVTAGVLNTTYQGGKTDGYVTLLSAAGNSVIASSYIGTSNYDQSFFVELDRFGNVYLLGQTLGNYPVTAGVYINPNSGQFITKLNSSLSTIIYSTRFGNGSGVNISPSAFLVDYCENVYVSGWGGSLSTQVPMTNMPLTANAFQSTTDGFNFYLIVFERNLLSLLYATYFGGSQSQEHVDGGTSRFDKNGIIYQSVCAGCTGNSDFPTTPGVVSNTNNATTGGQCNNGVFKFDFEIMPVADFIVTDTAGCAPFTVNFTNTSTNATSFLWDFGGGDTTSQVSNPVRTFSTPGVYPVYLIINDTICGFNDTSQINIHVFDTFSIQVSNDTMVCDTLPASIYGWSSTSGLTWHWSSNSNFIDTLNPGGTPHMDLYQVTGYFHVRASNPGCSVTDSVFVRYEPIMVEVNDTFSICYGDTFSITAQNFTHIQPLQYNWNSPGTILSGQGTDSIRVTGNGSFPVYLVTTGPFGCKDYDTAIVVYSHLNFQLTAFPDTLMCKPDSLLLLASNQGVGNNYHWSSNSLFSDTLNSSFGDSIIRLYFDATRTVYLKSSVAGCTKTDSLVIVYAALSGYIDDLILCEGNRGSILANITGNSGTNLSYQWSPQAMIEGTLTAPSALIQDGMEGIVRVMVSNTEGCSFLDSAEVIIIPSSANATANPDTILKYLQSSQLNTFPGGSNFYWQPSEGLSDRTDRSPQASPEETTTYYVNYNDSNGCPVSDSVTVWVVEVICEDPYVFIPTIFSPNGDNVNDVLYVMGNYIDELELMIYNRWGELVFETRDQQIGWDGNYNGRPADPAVFVYHMRVKCTGGTELFKKGNITLVR